MTRFANKINRFILVLAVVMVSGSCSESPSQLQRILERGQIRMVTHDGPSTYFVDKDGENGLEYLLAERFAHFLGVELSLTITRTPSDALDFVKNGQADIVIGSIKSFQSEQPPFLFGPNYQWAARQVLYRASYIRPGSLDDIYPDEIHVVRGTIADAEFAKIRKQHPELQWAVHNDKENFDLMEMLENGEILYAVALSNDRVLTRESFPEVRTAFNLTNPQPLAWAIQYSEDYSLLRKLHAFHSKIEKEGTLADLIERFYGPTGFFNYVDSRKFLDKYRKNLPALKAYFRRSGVEHNIDWRLLAALSYQESHWRKNARSHTGVRGLMMLTQVTAKQMGVKNRLDPEQSIEGGAKYLKSLINRIPERIQEPDRTWFALAAYNVGFGHLEDARILTQRDGANPDLWQDVKQRLPLLSKRKWYKQTKHGYARGHEPVKFVAKIRKYYNVLVNLTQEERSAKAEFVDTVTINSPVF